MLQNPLKRWKAIGAAASALLAIAGWLLFVGPQRSAASENWAEFTAAQEQTTALQTRISSLARQFEDIDARKAELAIKRESLPYENDLEALVRTLNEVGDETGIAIEAVTAQEPLDISPKPPEPPKPTAGSAPAPTTPLPGAAPPATKWKLYVLPVTIQARGSLASMERFLRVIQTEEARAILFTSFALMPDTDSTTLEESVMLTASTNVFVSPIVGSTPPSD